MSRSWQTSWAVARSSPEPKFPFAGFGRGTARAVSVETLLKRYPALGAARVLDALSFAYDNEDLIAADLAREEALLGDAPEAVPGAMTQSKLPFE